MNPSLRDKCHRCDCCIENGAAHKGMGKDLIDIFQSLKIAGIPTGYPKNKVCQRYLKNVFGLDPEKGSHQHLIHFNFIQRLNL